MLDLDGDGVETTSLSGANAAYFDHDHNGFAEASGWVDADDGLLSIDLNADGVINNGAELFGDQTGQLNGFLALAQYDNNEDEKITGEDLVWGKLRVWQDANGDGVSQEGELHTLDSLNITSIDLAYTDVNTTNNGNAIKQTSSFTINGNTNTVSDVYFAVNANNSIYREDYELDIRALSLPLLRGYGELPDLYIAMSLDNAGAGNLLDLVQNFAAMDFDDLFESTDLRVEVRAILYRWAGVEGVATNSRGNNVDAQELGFLEKLVGENYFQRGWHNNAGPDAGRLLSETFDKALSDFTAKLMLQGAGKELFSGDITYNPISDTIEGSFVLDTGKLADLETEATGLSNTGDRELFGAISSV